MHRHRMIFAVTGVLALPACGIPYEEYDARTAELRKADERVKGCADSIKVEQLKTAEAQQSSEEMKAQIANLQKDRLPEAALANYKKLLAQASRGEEDAGQRKLSREALAAKFRQEIEAGAIWVDDRNGTMRLMMPEEALYPEKAFSALSANGKKVLDAVAREIKLMPARQLVVAAYLDRGPKTKAKEDFTLSIDRARRAADYLTTKGLEPEMLAAIGWGSADPIADNENDDARQRNRRVEIQFLGPITLLPKAVPGAPATGAPGAGLAPLKAKPPTLSPLTDPIAGERSQGAKPAAAPVKKPSGKSPSAGDDPGL